LPNFTPQVLYLIRLFAGTHKAEKLFINWRAFLFTVALQKKGLSFIGRFMMPCRKLPDPDSYRNWGAFN
jgi:hypothetical protein